MKKFNRSEHGYSFHTFLYPFQITGMSREAFEQQYLLPNEATDENRLHWQRHQCADDFLKQQSKVRSSDKASSESSEGPTPLEKENYMLFQYYNEAARLALGIKDNDIVHQFEISSGTHVTVPYSRKEDVLLSSISSQNSHKQADRSSDTADAKDSDTAPKNDDIQEHCLGYYLITKARKTIRLRLHGIRLYLFNTNIGILSFETEFWGEDQRNGRFLSFNFGFRKAAYKFINEFGRRVFPPIIGDFSLTADTLSLEFAKNQKPIKTIFVENGFVAPNWQREPERTAEIISDILSIGLAGKQPEEEPKEGQKLPICPAVDDRMFVCSLISDDQYLGELRNRYWHKKYDKGDPFAVQKDLYELINVDTDKGSSCQSPSEVEKYLKAQIYERWIEWGTFHAITDYSMICMTGPGGYIAVTVPFLTEYVPMAILAIAQRASLLYFEKQVVGATGKKKEEDQWKAVDDIQKRITRYECEILLPEVTSQIQGIEIYERLQKAMNTQALSERVDKQIKAIHSRMRSWNDEQNRKNQEDSADQNNYISMIFTVIGGGEFIDLLAVIIPCFEGSIFQKGFGVLWIIALFYTVSKMPASMRKSLRDKCHKVKGFFSRIKRRLSPQDTAENDSETT